MIAVFLIVFGLIFGAAGCALLSVKESCGWLLILVSLFAIFVADAYINIHRKRQEVEVKEVQIDTIYPIGEKTDTTYIINYIKNVKEERNRED